MMGFGFILMLLFWGGIILLAVWLIMALFPTHPQSPLNNKPNNQPGPRDVLDQRYARGELSREQYDKMRQMINSNQSH